MNAERDIKDKAFIIAHELGQYILHCKNAQGRYYAHRENKKGEEKEEQDADSFAASLLMPEDLFGKRYKELKDKELSEKDCISLLVQDFSAPKDAVEKRIKEIDNGSKRL